MYIYIHIYIYIYIIKAGASKQKGQSHQDTIIHTWWAKILVGHGLTSLYLVAQVLWSDFPPHRQFLFPYHFFFRRKKTPAHSRPKSEGLKLLLLMARLRWCFVFVFPINRFFFYEKKDEHVFGENPRGFISVYLYIYICTYLHVHVYTVAWV